MKSACFFFLLIKLPSLTVVHIRQFCTFYWGKPFWKRVSLTGTCPLCPSDISPSHGESSSNSFPKTFSAKFCPYRALFNKVKSQSLLGAPYMGKINIKSLWKGVRGQAPHSVGRCHASDRGDRLRQRNLSSERFPPITSINFYISITVRHSPLFYLQFCAFVF